MAAIIVTAILLIDQAIKVCVKTHMYKGESIRITHWFFIHFTENPGMAFGTGTHETTRLVMKIMQDEIRGGEKLLDVGTGSGILSICASKLGAEHCWAYDIDPVAVKVARENAKDGGITNMTVDVSDLLYGVDKSVGKFDFCVANIVADIILRMLPDIKNYLKDGAPLILSGIINLRADEIREAVRQHGFTIIREEQENDWVALLVK